MDLAAALLVRSLSLSLSLSDSYASYCLVCSFVTHPPLARFFRISIIFIHLHLFSHLLPLA